jgi:hypothetical protein
MIMFIRLFCSILMVFGFLIFVCNIQAAAQIIPIPPPMPGMEIVVKDHHVRNDNRAPVIEFLTKELRQGKNVFKVKITDESSIRLREIKYTQNGEIMIGGLVRDQNNVFKALIVATPPSAVIVVNADDIYGNKATAATSISVSRSSNIFSQIWNIFHGK